MAINNPRTRLKVDIHRRWRRLANMCPTDIEILLSSKEGKKGSEGMLYIPGVGNRKAGTILRRLMKMRYNGFHTWTDYDWLVAQAQVNNIVRCHQIKKELLTPKEKGKKRKATNKYIKCLMWGNDPLRKQGVSFKKFVTKAQVS